MPVEAVISDAIVQDIRSLATQADARLLVMGGVNYRTASIQVREKMAFHAAALTAVLQELAAHPAVEEVLLLSTCNRTEVYLFGDRGIDWQRVLPELLAAHCQATPDELSAALYLHEGEAAAHHLFRVAAGLDSMVIGECEIVRQIKCAAQCARDEETSGAILQRLTEKALAASKRARSQVRYDDCGLSVAALAVTACKRAFHEDLHNRCVLVLGAGETAEMTLQYLVNKGVQRVFIANRTLARAQELAAQTGGTALTLDAFPQYLANADLIITCTSSPQPLITRAMLAPVMAAQPDKRLLLIDLAVPRDVEAEVNGLPGVRLLNVDSLQGTAAELSRERQAKIQDAERIIADEAREFGAWLASRKTVDVMKALAVRIEHLRAEIEADLAGDLHLTPQERARVIQPRTRALAEGIIREALRAMQEVTGLEADSRQLQLASKVLEQYSFH